MISRSLLTGFILMSIGFIASAQSTTNPDTVCAGSNVYYKIQNPISNSTFTWGIYGIGGTLITTNKSDSIRVTWANTAGIDSIWVFETNVAGCKGDTAKIKVVRVAPPTAQFDNSALCYGNNLYIRFTGYPPYGVEYTLNGNTNIQSGMIQNLYSVGGTAGNYVLVRVSDKHCSNNAPSGTINAVIAQPLNKLQISHD